MNATVRVAESLKPEKASDGERIPVRTKDSINSRPTTSTESFSVMKSTTATITMARTIHSWGLMGCWAMLRAANIFLLD
jgi:hypothetical protein